MNLKHLQLPEHFQRENADAIWRVEYQQLAAKAAEWAGLQQISPMHSDRTRICLLLVDCQNTFCTPGFELFVAGRSGRAAVDDSIRIAEFIYRNLGVISNIAVSLDSHQAVQIFHQIFLVDKDGKHPNPLTPISLADVLSGKWKVDPEIAAGVSNGDYDGLQRHLLYYCRQLEQHGKYQLMIWPYHAMLGGIGHALVSLIEEAVFFHSIARRSRPHFELKGADLLTENYSIFHPEVSRDEQGRQIGPENTSFLNQLLEFDKIIIAGQAKSHCVAWTVSDLLSEVSRRHLGLANRVYLLEDCSSPVVVPGVADFTAQADRAFYNFAGQGVHLVRSTDPILAWSGWGN